MAMRLNIGRFSSTEFVNKHWTCTVEVGTTLEEVLQPAFFSNVAMMITPYDQIIVRTDDGSWYAELLVLMSGPSWAKVHLKYSANLLDKEDSGLTQDQEDKFIVAWRGPHLKWCVTRKDDKMNIKEVCNSKVEAYSWLREYLRAVVSS